MSTPLTASTIRMNQRVKLIATNHGDDITNPVFGGSQDNVLGEVIYLSTNFAKVKWDNGCDNLYYFNDLEDATVVTPTVVVAPTPAAPVVVPVGFATAVADILNENVNAGKHFSNFDVTAELRNRVNNGKVVIDGRSFEDVNGTQTQKIFHGEVRDIVVQTMRASSAYTRVWNGAYFVYQPTTSSPVTPGSTVPSVVVTPTATVSTPAVPVDVLGRQIRTYIQTRGNKTLKQIQSRFKKPLGAGQITVRTLADAAKNEGLRIDPHSTYHASVVSL